MGFGTGRRGEAAVAITQRRNEGKWRKMEENGGKWRKMKERDGKKEGK